MTTTTPQTLTDEITQIITDAIIYAPRSLQKRIGPSELGTPCDHCLAAKLAGWQQTPGPIAWTAARGTAMHAWLEDTINTWESRHATPGRARRFWTERTVTVGTIGTTPITGSTDLLDTENGVIVDWKNVGKARLNHYRAAGPPQIYRVQANLYAKGWIDTGLDITHTAICFLPAEGNTFTPYWWIDAVDLDLAKWALERANRLHTLIQAINKQSGHQALATWISTLKRDPDCYDCNRWPDTPINDL